MRYTLKQLSAFVSVASTLNMSATAKQLCLSTPAVHKQIRLLEEAAQVKLFQNRGRQLEITPEGRQLLLTATRLLKQANQFNTELLTLSNLKINQLNLCVLNTFLPALYNSIQSYCDENPMVDVQIQAPSWRLIHQQLQTMTNQIVLMGEPEVNLDASFHKEVICESDIVLVASSKHPLANKKFNEELFRDARFITGISKSKNQKLQDQFFESLHLTKRPFRFDSYAHIHDATRANMGIAFLPKIVVNQDLKDNILKLIPIDATLPTVALYLILKKELQEDKWVSNFIQHIRLSIS